MTRRWNNALNTNVESPQDIEAFLADIRQVFIRHNMSISHEDSQGAFEINEFIEDNFEWLSAAHDARDNAAEQPKAAQGDVTPGCTLTLDSGNHKVQIVTGLKYNTRYYAYLDKGTLKVVEAEP